MKATSYAKHKGHVQYASHCRFSLHYGILLQAVFKQVSADLHGTNQQLWPVLAADLGISIKLDHAVVKRSPSVCTGTGAVWSDLPGSVAVYLGR